MKYLLSSLQLGILLLPVTSIVLFVPYVIRQKRRPGGLQPVQTILYYSFCLYMLCLFFITSLPLPTEEELAGMKAAGPILEPFRYFTRLAERTGFSLRDPATWYKAVFSPFAMEFIMNIVLLVPEGMYLRGVFRLSRRKSLLIVLGTTLFIEISQLTGLFFLFSKPYRHFEVDDLITNFIGGALGYWLMGKLMPVLERLETKASAAFGKGRRVTAFRRLLAWAVDADIVLGAGYLLTLIPGWERLTGAVPGPVMVTAGLLICSLLTTVLFGGRTVGSWLFRFHAVAEPGRKAGRLRLALRSVVLYGGLTGLELLCDAAARQTEVPAFRVVSASCAVLLIALMTYQTAVLQLFPGRDYPWGILSGTRLEELPPFTLPGRTKGENRSVT